MQRAFDGGDKISGQQAELQRVLRDDEQEKEFRCKEREKVDKFLFGSSVLFHPLIILLLLKK